MVQDGTLKDQIHPDLMPYSWLSRRTSKVYQTPFLGKVKVKKAMKGRRLRGTISQANHAARKLRSKVDA